MADSATVCAGAHVPYAPPPASGISRPSFSVSSDLHEHHDACQSPAVAVTHGVYS